MKIINDNPYRILGVFSTSPQREIVANLGRMKAFINVGREISFPLDLNGILPTITRTTESVAEANSKLTLPAEQLKYSQFWFAKCTPIDEIACAKLTRGDIEGAVEIWNKSENPSSLQNRLVCALIKSQLGNAISYAEKLYGIYEKEFLKMILGENAIVTTENPAYDFLNVLCDEFNPKQFISNITKTEWKEYVGSKSTKPLIDKISSAIEVCKSSKGKGATARLNAGTKLMNNTKTDLAQLKEFVPSSDLQYQMIADKLGLEILQCGIDYYNDSEEPEAARKALVLQSYAQSVVVGKMAKDRCKENVDILNKIIKELPPASVFSEDRAIKEELRKFCRLPDKICYSVDLLNNTKPHLQAIRNKLGSSNSYYLKISTQVVGNALHNVIEEVNALQKDQTFQINMILDKYAALASLKSVLRSAWEATKLMDTFDMESDFKNNRYNENRRTLSDMCSQVGVPTYSSSYSGRSSSRTTSTSSSSSGTSRAYGSGSSRTYGSGSSTGSSGDDTNWGCIIAAAIAFIIFCISTCN